MGVFKCYINKGKISYKIQFKITPILQRARYNNSILEFKI